MWPLDLRRVGPAALRREDVAVEPIFGEVAPRLEDGVFFLRVNAFFEVVETAFESIVHHWLLLSNESYEIIPEGGGFRNYGSQVTDLHFPETCAIFPAFCTDARNGRFTYAPDISTRLQRKHRCTKGGEAMVILHRRT